MFLPHVWLWQKSRKRRRTWRTMMMMMMMICRSWYWSILNALHHMWCRGSLRVEGGYFSCQHVWVVVCKKSTGQQIQDDGCFLQYLFTLFISQVGSRPALGFWVLTQNFLFSLVKTPLTWRQMLKKNKSLSELIHLSIITKHPRKRRGWGTSL